MVGKLLAPEIQSLIDARNSLRCASCLAEWPPVDVAPTRDFDLPEDEKVIICRVLPDAQADAVFEYMGLEVDEQQKPEPVAGNGGPSRSPQFQRM